MRYFIEGVLSFVKGCEQFVFGARNAERTRFNLLQNSENPAAYAKLSCHLPWIAEQYGLSYDADDDPSCKEGTGELNPDPKPICRNTLGTDLTGKEHHCIFPFYYNTLATNTCNPDLDNGGPGCQRLLDPDDDSCE